MNAWTWPHINTVECPSCRPALEFVLCCNLAPEGHVETDDCELGVDLFLDQCHRTLS